MRIHVERAIQRLKNFGALSMRIPATLLIRIEDIFYVCCCLVNLSAPIIKDAVSIEEARGVLEITLDEDQFYYDDEEVNQYDQGSHQDNINQYGQSHQFDMNQVDVPQMNEECVDSDGIIYSDYEEDEEMVVEIEIDEDWKK